MFPLKAGKAGWESDALQCRSVNQEKCAFGIYWIENKREKSLEEPIKERASVA